MPIDTKEVKAFTPSDSVVDIPCIECKRSTKHKVWADVVLSGEDWFGENSITYQVKHQVAQCRGCETFTFRQVSTNSEEYDMDDRGNAFEVEAVSLYPNRSDVRLAIEDTSMLPPKVRRIYEETLAALNSSQPILAGIGLRAILEAICATRKASGKDLSLKIDSLVTMGGLASEDAKILHKIRMLGNRAAHEVKPHNSQQLKVALDVAEHLLHGVFLLPNQTKKAFKSRKK